MYCNVAADPIGVVALVRVHNFAVGELFEQGRARLAIGDLPAGEHERDRTAERIGQRVDFRRTCEFRRNSARDSDLMSATVPI